MDDFSIEVEEKGCAVIAHLSGCFKNEDVKQLYTSVLSFNDYEVIIMNLEKLAYIDSGGIAGIIGLSRRVMRMHNAHLVLCSVNKSIMNVFQTMRLDRVFPFHKNLQNALEAESIVDREPNPG